MPSCAESCAPTRVGFRLNTRTRSGLAVWSPACVHGEAQIDLTSSIACGVSRLTIKDWRNITGKSKRKKTQGRAWLVVRSTSLETKQQKADAPHPCRLCPLRNPTATRQNYGIPPPRVPPGQALSPARLEIVRQAARESSRSRPRRRGCTHTRPASSWACGRSGLRTPPW